MNHSSPPPDDSWESDTVWKLLDEATPMTPRASFADDVVRMAKLEHAPAAPWWRRFLSPAPIAGFATAAAAVLLGVFLLNQTPSVKSSHDDSLTLAEPADHADPYEDLQDLAETEMLIAAADHLDSFSDRELGDLIGF